MTRVDYSADFIARVKAAFPDKPLIHYAVDNGSPLLSGYLFDSKPDSTAVSLAKLVVNPQDNDSAVDMARRILEIEDLCHVWDERYANNNPF